MANRLSALLIRSVHETGPARGACSDSELVTRFVDQRDGDSFAALVHRHGALVLGVCRRVLGQEQDAEDVFQAVFLVLSRKAAALRDRGGVGPFLYGVAYRLALRARQSARKQQDRTRHQDPAPAGVDPLEDLSVREAHAVLDEELARLPERERGPLILCYLEGLTRDEAARQLGCPIGTLKSRLERGRTALQKRLAQRGLGLPTVLATLLLTRVPASGVSPALCEATTEAARAFAGQVSGSVVPAKSAALAGTMLRSALPGKFALAATVLLVIIACGFGAGHLTAPAPDARPDGRVDTSANTEEVRLRSTVSSTGERAGPVTPELPPARLALAPPPTEKRTEVGKPADQEAKPEPEPLPTNVNGVAKVVHAEGGTLLVAHRDGEELFSVAAGAEIQIDDKPGALAQLPVGANVSLTRFVDPKTVGRVQAGGRSFFGNQVKAVDAVRSTITIKDRDEEKTFTVARDTFLTIDGKGAKLSAVPPGSFVNMGLAADQQTARHIGVSGAGLGGCGGSLVASVDRQKRTITFDKKASPDVAGKTFTVAADAHITINGNRTGTLVDVPAGCYVNLLLRVDGKTAGQVQAQGPSNLCGHGGSVVSAVDLEKGLITFNDRARSEVAGKTFTLAKDAHIVVDGKKGTLAAVRPGSVVDMRLWVDRRTVGTLYATGSSVPGTGVVRAVDIQKHAITVGDRTYPVARDANIQVEGKTVRLAGVPVGISVALRLNVDQQTVGTIHHTKP
jgi:RNA polymerase sigma factor (sigma-70 family)